MWGRIELRGFKSLKKVISLMLILILVLTLSQYNVFANQESYKGNTDFTSKRIDSVMKLTSNGYDGILKKDRAKENSEIEANSNTKWDKITYKGFKVKFNGEDIIDKNNTTLSYKWSISIKPQGSQAEIIMKDTLTPYFIPDIIGEYKVILTINNGNINSEERTYNIKVKDMSNTVDDVDLSFMDTVVVEDIGNYTVNRPVPLSDGWIISADDTNKIKVLNVFTGEIGKEYQLTAKANSLDFDFEKQIIFASLSGVNKIVKIDINKDSISYIDTPYNYVDIVNGENNCVFAITRTSGVGYISTIDIEQKCVMGSLQEDILGAWQLAYDKNKNNLFACEDFYSSGELYRFSFDENTKALAFKQKVDGNSYYTDLAISSDGKHIAYPIYNGKKGYYIYDYDTSDLTKTFGGWDCESGAGTVAFSPDNNYIAASNGLKLQIFNAQNHYCIKSIDLVGCSNLDRVRFSRGGRIIYNFSTDPYKKRISCFKNTVEPQLQDLSKQPIVITEGDLNIYKGFKVGFNESDSSGADLNYRWTIISKPQGSLAEIVNGTTAAPYFIPDAIGEFKVSLAVNDGTKDINVKYFTVKVKDINSIIDDFDEASITGTINYKIDEEVIAKPRVLSDGWIITADSNNKIKIVNVITGAVGKEYQVTAKPNCIDFALDKNLIMASLDGANKIAVIDVAKDEISYIDTPYINDKIVYGKDNYCFAMSECYISNIDIGTKQIVNYPLSHRHYSGTIVYDKYSNSILVNELSIQHCELTRYFFDDVTRDYIGNQIVSKDVNGLDLAISSDGKHLAYCCEQGKVKDIDTSNITQSFGEWNTGEAVSSAGFSMDNRYIATAQVDQLKIFDVQNHVLVKTLNRVNSKESEMIQFSRGGKLVFDYANKNIRCCLSSGSGEVYKPVSGITLNKTSLILHPGESINLINSISPVDALNKNVKWLSNNTAVVKVDNNGEITAVAKGNACIGVFTEDGNYSAVCDITVEKAVSGVRVDKSKVRLELDRAINLTATIYPSDANNKNVTWISSNNSVATVDPYGKVTAVGQGEATITARTEDGGYSESCYVTVIKPVTLVFIYWSHLDLRVGEVVDIDAEVSPADATNRNVIWSSSNPLIATVDNDGKITAVRKGAATITATSSDGPYASCEVTVTGETVITPIRYGGASRFETAVKVSNAGWQASQNVVLVNAYGFADALTGVPFAYLKDAPILLTDVNSIPKATSDEISRLGAKNIYILGGTGVISQNVEKELKNKQFNVVRLAGTDRFDTGIQIGNEVMKSNLSKTAVVTTAYNYPDALSISSYAAMQHYPILYTEINVLNPKVKEFIKNNGITKIIIPGGTGAVSETVVTELSKNGITVERISGSDRYETGLNIVKHFKSSFKNDVILATGSDFPDALAGGVLAAKKQIPVLLVDKNYVSDGVKSYIRANGDINMYILGGTGVVPDNVIDFIKMP